MYRLLPSASTSPALIVPSSLIRLLQMFFDIPYLVLQRNWGFGRQMSWACFLSQACLFFANSRNSKGPPTFHRGGNESMQLHTQPFENSPSSHRTSWSQQPKKVDPMHQQGQHQKVPQSSSLSHLNTRSLHLSILPSSFRIRRATKMKKDQNHNLKFEKQSLHAISTLARHCTAGIAGIPRWSESGCTGSSETKLLPCLARSSWWWQCSPEDAGIAQAVGSLYLANPQIPEESQLSLSLLPASAPTK